MYFSLSKKITVDFSKNTFIIGLLVARILLRYSHKHHLVDIDGKHKDMAFIKQKRQQMILYKIKKFYCSKSWFSIKAMKVRFSLKSKCFVTVKMCKTSPYKA